MKDTYSSKSLITTLKVSKRNVGSQEQCFEFHFLKRDPSEREGDSQEYEILPNGKRKSKSFSSREVFVYSILV